MKNPQKFYYKYGTRTIYSEEEPEGVVRYYAFQWETGDFEEDFSYRRKINHDLSGEKEELTETDFNLYVEKLKEERNL